jgi:hypothetical protein
MTHQKLPDQEEAVVFGSAPEMSRVRWDDPRIRSAYANVLSVSAIRGEISVSFGLQDAYPPDATEVPVRLSDHIVMSPQTARRLLGQLRGVLDAGNPGLGMAGPALQAPSETGQTGSPAPRRSRAGTPGGDEKASRLFQLVQGLGGEVSFERSFKTAHQRLLGNRFLLSASTGAIRGKAEEKLLGICVALGMPDALLARFRAAMPDASYVHFGFEEDGRTYTYKAYLEFWGRINREMRDAQAPEPSLLHLGFKWDASDNAVHSVTHYTWLPWLSYDEIQGRLAELLAEGHGPSLGMAIAVLRLASVRVPSREVLYLEVSEEDNPRRSFDLNVYRAGLQVGELYPLLAKMWQQHSIPATKWQALYSRAAAKSLGHVAGGLDRAGRDFLTVYYGVEGDQAVGVPPPLPVQQDSDGVGRGQNLSCGSTPFRDVEKTDEKAAILFQRVKGLRVPIGLERSFKMVEGGLQSDRFLLGFKRGSNAGELDERVRDICRQLGMPAEYLDAFGGDLPEATIVLFGFEGNRGECVYKAYLEFGARLGAISSTDPVRPAPFPIHIGYKWSPSDASDRMVTRYTCFPALGLDEMLQRIERVFPDPTYRGAFELAQGIVRLAASRIEPGALLFLESAEANSPRAAFDINLYPAKLRMGEIYPFLVEMSRHFSISVDQLHARYRWARSELFGHLAGGVDRSGRGFFTLYFGEKGGGG